MDVIAPGTPPGSDTRISHCLVTRRKKCTPVAGRSRQQESELTSNLATLPSAEILPRSKMAQSSTDARSYQRYHGWQKLSGSTFTLIASSFLRVSRHRAALVLRGKTSVRALRRLTPITSGRCCRHNLPLPAFATKNSKAR